MPILDRTPLNSSDKFELLLKTIACQVHGAVSSLSDEFNVSRKAVYSAKYAAQSALKCLVTTNDESDVITSVNVDVPHLRRSIVALSITAPNSIRAIEEQIPLIYPGCKVSYGYIQGVIVEAQEQAKLFNEKVSLSAIKSVAIDEMFSQGDPVLAGIDLESGYLFSLSHEQKRDGETWARVLGEAKSQGLSPQHVVKDGAKGIAKGVSMSFEHAEQRDDAFHALYIVGKALRKVERRAYYYIDKEASLEKRLHKDVFDTEKKQQAMVDFLGVQAKCEQAIEQYESGTKSRNHLHQALTSISMKTGSLMTKKQAEALLTKAVDGLKNTEHKDGITAARYIKNRLKGLTLATQALHEKLLKLGELYPQECVEVACRFSERKRQLRKAKPWKIARYQKELVGSYQWLRLRLGKSASELMLQVEALHQTRHRASSAIEGFNATLRSYLYVRKGVNQGFLELFKAWYNLRSRRWGKHKGTSSYQNITGKKVDDWLTMLNFPPSDLHH
ncbi:transposase [Parashewanella spongiae]|uniref:transposase n=2 Tax=Parashewanella spongiae TaxID=342950 RepID=UPI0010596C5E|nr:transposase [Parashewanella spongiae]